MAKLLNRFGRKLAALTDLKIEYPVGRSGARFEAWLVPGALYNIDTTQLRFFVILDEHGDDYPAMIDRRSSVAERPRAGLPDPRYRRGRRPALWEVLDHPASLNELYDEDDERYDEQQMKQPAQRV